MLLLLRSNERVLWLINRSALCANLHLPNCWAKPRLSQLIKRCTTRCIQVNFLLCTNNVLLNGSLVGNEWVDGEDVLCLVFPYLLYDCACFLLLVFCFDLLNHVDFWNGGNAAPLILCCYVMRLDSLAGLNLIRCLNGVFSHGLLMITGETVAWRHFRFAQFAFKCSRLF